MFVAVSTKTMNGARRLAPVPSNDQPMLTPHQREVLSLKAKIDDLELKCADLQASMMRLIQMRDDGQVADLTPRVPIRDICSAVLVDFPDVTVDDVLSPRRAKMFVRPRDACIAAVYVQRKDLSLPAIGRWFNRDHTTILHSVRKTGVYTPSKQDSAQPMEDADV